MTRTKLTRDDLKYRLVSEFIGKLTAAKAVLKLWNMITPFAKYRRRCLPLLCLVLLLAGCATKEQAELVIHGTIYTADDEQPVVESVAVANGKILFAGSSKSAEAYIGTETRVINLGESVMTPGFIEGHGHIMGVGYGEMELNLSDVRNYEELVARVREAVRHVPPGEWIVGRGWHQDKWDRLPEPMVQGFQTHHLLSSVSPDNPVFLRHASGHAALANARAMALAGVNPLTPERMKQGSDTEGGEIIRDAAGNPTGIFNERAMGIIERHIPEQTVARDSLALRLALETCLRNGLTGFHDAGTTQRRIDLFKSFRDAGALPIRLYVMLAGPQLARQWFNTGPEIDPHHVLTIRSIKLSCDGALGSRGAWLLEPYSDRPDTHGMATMSMDTVYAIARDALKHGFQVCSHAIGDRANREVLDQYARAFLENPDIRDPRFRIEHAQHLHPADIPRFAELGVIASMQAIHMSSDRPWAIDRLGEKRIKEGAYVWQSLLKSGARIVNGTDAPVEPLNPLACFYAAVSRKTLQGTPEGGYEPEQKMTREQALRSYTIDAAYAAFQDDVLGSITPGKYADFTVFSRDIMQIPEDDIPGTDVVMTIVGGEILYNKGRD